MSVAAVAATSESVEALLAKANAALAAEQLFEPAGRSALELYLAALDAIGDEQSDNQERPARRLSDAMASNDRQEQLQLAIADMFPAGLIWIERALANDRRADASRVLELMERAQPQSLALSRLREIVEQEPEPLSPVAAATPQPTLPKIGEPAAQNTHAGISPLGDAAPVSAVGAQRPTTVPVAPPPALVDTLAALAAAVPTAQSTTLAASPSTVPSRSAEDSARTAVASLVVVSQVPPRYPPRALNRRLDGWVLVEFSVQPDGSVDEVSVLNAVPKGVFDLEAVRSMQRWKFEPPGHVVTAQRRIEFKVDKR